MYIKNQKDFYSGVMFICVGGGFAWGANTYSIGTGARMEPGYFPLILGVILGLLGTAIAVKALMVKTEDGEKVGAIAWRPLFFIIVANLIFGVCIGGLPSIGLPPLGLVIGIILLTSFSTLADDGFKPKKIATRECQKFCV